MGITLGLVLISIASLFLAAQAYRKAAASRELASAWRYLQWDDAALAQLRARLAAQAGAPSLRISEPSLQAVDAAIAMKREFARRIAGTRNDFHSAGAMEARLLALNVDGTHYELVPMCIGRLDLAALHRSGRLSCVSNAQTGSPAFAAVMARDTLRHFMLPENDPWFAPSFRWFLSLPSAVAFVLVHLVPVDTAVPALPVAGQGLPPSSGKDCGQD